ncbi:MAG: hypothetical protein E7330_03490 [Clostridiales bacterium]|nr:hypothetical protein [Clostridiales bacterium]
MEFLIIIGIIVSIVNAIKKKNKEAEQAAKRRQAVFDAESAKNAQQSDERQQTSRAAGEAGERPRQDTAAERARADARAADYRRQREGSAPSQQPITRWRCRCGCDNEENASFCTACGKARAGGSMNAATTEGRAASFEGMSVSGEGMSAPGAYMSGVKRREVKAPSTTVPGTAKAAKHVVKPLTESVHSHVESSIAGIEKDCHVPEDTAPMEEDAYRIEEAAGPAGISLAFDRNAAVQGLLYAEILGKPRAMRK